jgi:hypothetical protein
MVDLQTQYAKIKDTLDARFAEVLESCHFINGQPVKTFADSLAEYLKVKSVIPCGNGTDALQIALMALGLKPGDEVITTPFTFVATAEVIALLGLEAGLRGCQSLHLRYQRIFDRAGRYRENPLYHSRPFIWPGIQYGGDHEDRG